MRLAVLWRLAVQPVPDPGRVLFAATLSKLASLLPDERTAGMNAAVAQATDADAPAFTAAFTRLRPQRRELASSVADFAAATRSLGSRLLEVRSAALAAIEAEPGLVSLQVQLAAARFAAEPFAQWTLKLVGTPRWHAATQSANINAMAATPQAVNDLERGESVWASTDAAARWLALRLLVWIAAGQGWSDIRRVRLRHYREDPSPFVADEDSLVFPPDMKLAAPAAT